MEIKVTNKIQSVMGFDYGKKRIGLAVGERLLQTANGIGFVNATDGKPNWDQLDAFIKEWQPDAFIVGLPLNMDGTASDMSRRANKFHNRIHNRYGKPSFTIDERLSTFAAKEEARSLGHKGHYKSDPVDALAARFILETWLNQYPLEQEQPNSDQDSE